MRWIPACAGMTNYDVFGDPVDGVLLMLDRVVRPAPGSAPEDVPGRLVRIDGKTVIYNE